MNIPVSYDTSIRNNAWKKSVSRMPCNQYISRWTASASGGSLTFKSTTKNSSSTSGTISFYGSTYQDGVLTPSPSTITISQNGTNISGTITIKGTGAGINTCSTSAAYPIDGNTTNLNYYFYVLTT